jgi:hypothetical protein
MSPYFLIFPQDPKAEEAFAFSSHYRVKNLNQDDRRQLLNDLSSGRLSIKEFRVECFQTYQKYEILKSLVVMLRNEGTIELDAKETPKLTDLLVPCRSFSAMILSCHANADLLLRIFAGTSGDA